MSDKPISKGDLVMVVRGHRCALQESGGVPFVFRKTYSYHGNSPVSCARCGEITVVSPGTYPQLPKSLGDWVVDISWLKRIPPLDERESEQRDEEITA